MLMKNARDTDRETEAHCRGDNEISKHMDGMLDGEDHGSTLTRNNEDDRTGAWAHRAIPAAPIAFILRQAWLKGR